MIKKSWISISKIDPLIIGEVFCTKLFYDNPQLRQIFPKNMEEEYHKYFGVLDSIITRLDNLVELRADIVDMAKRHVAYGVRPEHYNLVGKALLLTLQKGLGPEWTDEIRSAWINCYAVLSGTMIAVTAT